MKRTVITVMAYEDLAVAKLAKEKWDLMVGTLRHNQDVELRLWNFDALRFPELNNLAVKDAAQAEVIMVATNGAADFSPAVKGWIEEWLAQQRRQSEAARLLMFLCAPPSEQPGAGTLCQFAHLQWAARRGGMDFLASTSPAPARPSLSNLSTCQPPARVPRYTTANTQL